MASSAAKRVRSAVPYSPRASIGFRIPHFRFEIRLAWLLVFLVLPAIILAATLYLWHPSVAVMVVVLVVLALLLAFIATAVFRNIVRPLQTLSNVVAALRENEYSLRARDVGAGDALGDLAAQINELASDLRIRRHRESETFALLERVVETMDLPVFAFDSATMLQLTNPAAVKLLQSPAESLLHNSADSLGLSELLQCAESSIVSLKIRGREGRWMVRRSKFYQSGMPHTLLLLSDVSGVLREQERQAWQRLIRVLAHEVNNSLAPIKSIAGSLRLPVQRLRGRETGADASSAREQPTTVNPVDLEHGLSIIEERAESLNRFLQGYSQLAKLPPPVKSRFILAPILERVCHLETRIPVKLEASDQVPIEADAAQMEQALINLIRNAADAAISARMPQADPRRTGEPVQGSPRVIVSCAHHAGVVRIRVEDNGSGLANPANLFIPFYTTKPGGTGIGLILALQIVEAHGGTLTLSNRANARGCCAEIRLPISINLPSSEKES
jgi:two-component system, NtrC family, nitrogen regulation sensor histidine kinase NtrY